MIKRRQAASPATGSSGRRQILVERLEPGPAVEASVTRGYYGLTGRSLDETPAMLGMWGPRGMLPYLSSCR